MRLFEFEDKDDTSRTERYRQQQVDREVTLQRWLQQNPEVLLEETLLVIGRETSSGSGPIDLLALDRFGNTIIFEMKTGDTKSESTSEDKIIGQPQRYAAAIESWDYEKLNEVYQEYQNEIASEKWNVDGSTMTNDSLTDGFDNVFGTTPNQFNKGVIESISHRDHGASRIVSTFLIGNGDDESKTQREVALCSRMDAASGRCAPEAAVGACSDRSFGL